MARYPHECGFGCLGKGSLGMGVVHNIMNALLVKTPRNCLVEGECFLNWYLPIRNKVDYAID